MFNLTCRVWLLKIHRSPGKVSVLLAIGLKLIILGSIISDRCIWMMDSSKYRLAKFCRSVLVVWYWWEKFQGSRFNIMPR